jgi:hypothetical protein
MGSLDSSIDLILPASNRNEYQEYSWGVKGGRLVRLTTLPTSESRLFREDVGASISHNPMGLHGLLKGQLYYFMPKMNERADQSDQYGCIFI